MTGFGMTQQEQAVILEIGERTLNTHFMAELKRGAAKADVAVMQNLFKIATGDGPNSGKCAIFWTKVRRRWHEVQRVIHGFDPEAIKTFVQQVIVILRRELPQRCPGCKTRLNLPKKIAGHLHQLSAKMAENLPPSQIVSADPKETV